jgi:hypothetical protein
MGEDPAKLIREAVGNERLSIEELRTLWRVLFPEREPPLCPHEPKLFPPEF